MDIKTVQGRFEHEGLSFLTIALPTFGKDLQKGLDLGYVDRRLFTGFQWKGGLPRLFGGFLDRVFDRGSGLLLTDPDVDAILAIRQLSLMYEKIALPCSDARRRKAMSGYIECELEVRQFDITRSKNQVLRFQSMFNRLFDTMLAPIDRAIYLQSLVPKHGPGATSDRISGNQKYNLRSWTDRLEEHFPALENLLPSHSYYDGLKDVHFHEPGSEIPVRVISVPKTLKTPRIIGIEPAAMQYAQQSILPELVRGIEGCKILNSLIGFDDQSPNQTMARQGSLTGSLATLDLSEASDRVSNQLVRDAFARFPFLHGAIDASRSRKADVPGYGVVRIAKFASMGSALCFPIEAMVFLTIICLGIEESLSKPLCRKDLLGLSGHVRVYGDDIIVPVDFVRCVVQELETFGFQVNLLKSYWNGKFRESCGKEYFNGEDVSIVRFRQEFPTQREHATRVISLISFRNQMYFSGYWDTCQWLDDRIRKLLRHFPVVAPTSRVLGRHSFLGYEIQKMHDTLHSPLVRGYVVSAVSPSDILDDVGALLKFHLKHARTDRAMHGNVNGWHDILPDVVGDHLERAGRPLAVNIKLRNALPF
jgi:hypothetical protein